MPRTAQELFERYHVQAYLYFRRTTGSRDAADDLMQELFLRVVRHVEACLPGREVSWMFRVARNLVVDYRRGHPERHVSLDEAPRMTAAPTQLLAFGMAEALALLPEADREAFLLHEVIGLSHQEVADACDATLNAVTLRVGRARLRLRALLSGRWSAGENKRRNEDD